MPESSFTYGGFTFRSNTGTIGNKEDYHTTEDLLHLGNVPLPEMMYPQNYLRVEHEPSGLRLQFNAFNALQSWHNLQLGTHGRTVTLPTTEKGTETHESLSSSSTSSANTTQVVVDVTHYDWTYMNNYEGDIDTTRPNTVPPIPSPTTRTLPLPLLTKRGTILYYAQVPLYSSDLADRGIVDCTVKIRVMEDGFLVLLRTYLRKDRESVWLRDVRWFGEFASTNNGTVRMPVDNDEISGSSSCTTTDNVVSSSSFTLLKDVQLRYTNNMDNLLQSLSYALPSTTSTDAATESIPVPVSILPSFLQAREPGSSASSTTMKTMLIDNPSSSSTGTGFASPTKSFSSSLSSPSSPSQSSTRTVVPVLKKSPIHPVVLQSMRERAAKQGYTVDDDGTMRNLDGTLIRNGNETVSPSSSLSVDHSSSSSSSVSSSFSTETPSGIAVQLFSTLSSSTTAASVPNSLPDYFRNGTASPNIDAIFALPVSTALPHYNITADEVYQALRPDTHVTYEFIVKERTV